MAPVSKCYYKIEVSIAVENKVEGGLNFQEFTKIFEDPNPILAREAVFRFYDNFVHSLLLGLGLSEKLIEGLSDREIRKALQPFINIDNILLDGEDELLNSVRKSMNGIWIRFITNVGIPQEYTIHKITKDTYPIPFPTTPYELDAEYQFYTEHGLEIKEYKTAIEYYDPEELWDGYPDTAYDSFTILKTPFDWTGYGEKYWWEQDEKNQTVELLPDQTYEEMLLEWIRNGESSQLEFKPALLYHFAKKGYSKTVRFHVAKTIASFMNSKGGILLIGVTDDKSLQGLSYDFSLASNGKNPRDYFRLEVDKIIREYFKALANNIQGDFYVVNGIEIFVLNVFPSKDNPVFIEGINGKEFFVRLMASSEPFTDVEQIVMYCLDRWKSSKA